MDPMLQDVLSKLSGLFMIGCYIPYIGGMLLWGKKPSRATWFVWASLDVMILIGMVKAGTQNNQIIGATTGSVIVALLSIWYGLPGWTKLDVFCLIGSGIGCILYLTTNESVSILACAITMLIGSLPTIRSAWVDHTHESATSWFLAFLSCIFYLPLLPAFQDWTIAKVAQPLTFSTIEPVMVHLVCVRPLWLKKPEEPDKS